MNIEMKMYDRERFGIQKGERIGISKGRQEGRQEEKREIALKMLKENLPMEMIIKLSGLSEAEVQELRMEAASHEYRDEDV